VNDDRPRSLLHIAAVVVGTVLFAGAVWVLHRELAHVSAREVMHEVSNRTASSVLAAAALTLLSYLAISGYDMLGLRYIGRPLPYRAVGPISLSASAVGQTVGFAVLSGGAIRYRMYSALGLSMLEIASLIGFVALTFGFGVSFLAACVFLFEPGEVTTVLPFSGPVIPLIGIVLLAPTLLILGAELYGVRELRLFRRVLPLPGIRITLGQFALAITDLLAASSVLYVLLPASADLSYPALLCVFVIALVAGIASHVPGGLGVFESVLVIAVPNVPKSELLGAILAYRAIYYFVPFSLAGISVAIHEFERFRGAPFGRALTRAQRALGSAVPQILAALVFAAGAILVFSSATPADPDRYAGVARYLSLPLIEGSHLAGSLLGVALMVLARGLHRRSAFAYRLAYAALVLGIAASLAKGYDWEEALVLAGVLVVLRVARREFPRATRQSVLRLNGPWLTAIAIVIAGSVWLVIFAYKHVEYSDALWWKFALDAHAPRSLRATLAAVLAISTLALMRLFRPPLPPPGTADAADLARARPLIEASPHPGAALALLGDKRLMFASGDEAMLMYQIRGRSWIALGEPIGEDAAGEDLAWDFVEDAEQHGGRAVFYQVPGEHLYRYIDMGLTTFKLGEEAIVNLRGFSLEGKARADLRQARRRGEREGARFEVVPKLDVPALLPELRRVSDAWLDDKHTREKGFALGRFDERYLAEFPCAVVRIGGELVAFANLWSSSDRDELSVDLMRHTLAAPKGIMDYLFVELMLWGAAGGYERFSLGLAPLSGLEQHALAPMWHRIGTTIFRHGEYFYNFEGLRAYKEKFDPVWQPVYLAARAGASLPLVLLDISALIAGGISGIVKR